MGYCNVGKKIAHPIAHQYYNYLNGVRFDPGAPAEAFQPLHQLPQIAIRGAGKVVRGRAGTGAFRVFQHPQVYFKPQIGIVGVGGVQAGQVIFQPLIDPNNGPAE